MHRRPRRPALLLPGSPPRFPPADEADDEGLVAIGGDLSAERLLAAYDGGIFPWYDSGLPPMWWSPDPRAVLEPERLHISRSMRRYLRSNRCAFTCDAAFAEVMQACGEGRQEGTWILPEMVQAYTALHERADAHSFEVWQEHALIGGLYGVRRGGVFCAESMFHRQTNASKVALIASVVLLSQCGIELYDVQFMTSHLASLGAVEMPRRGYLERLASARRRSTNLKRLRGMDLMPGLLSALGLAR